VLYILCLFTGTGMAIFNFLLFTGIIHDLCWHGTSCSLILLYTGFYLAWHLCCPRSVYSIALYWRCDGYILPL
jgi:hypothetical protein